VPGVLFHGQPHRPSPRAPDGYPPRPCATRPPVSRCRRLFPSTPSIRAAAAGVDALRRREFDLRRRRALGAFALHFTADIAAGRPDAAALWGITSAAALLIAGIVAPFVGAWADGVARTRRCSPSSRCSAACDGALAAARLRRDPRGRLRVHHRTGRLHRCNPLYDAYLERLGPTRGPSGCRHGAGRWASSAASSSCWSSSCCPATRTCPGSGARVSVVALMFLAIAIPAISGLRGVHPAPSTDAAGIHPWRRVAHTLAHWREQAPQCASSWRCS